MVNGLRQLTKRLFLAQFSMLLVRSEVLTATLQLSTLKHKCSYILRNHLGSKDIFYLNKPAFAKHIQYIQYCVNSWKLPIVRL